MTLIQKINPINKDSEQAKFWFDPNYNPQFEYPENISEEELLTHGQVDFTYFDTAKSILDKVIKQYDKESKYIEAIEGKVLTKQEVETAIHDYLRELGLEDSMQLKFSREFLARTSVHKNQISIRLPIDHREHSLQGVLNHEIGTHYLRNLNEMKQPWYQRRADFGLGPHLETEEGLAVLHYYLAMEEKYLWIQALYYYAVCQGSKMSFSKLYKDLEKYVDDKERRWKVCLRVKRGVRDTSTNLVFSKDQVYLLGVIKIARWLQENQYDASPLYVGKVSIEDLPRIQNEAVMSELALPRFFMSQSNYKKSIEDINKINKLFK